MPILLPEKDPMGHAILDYYNGRRKSKIKVYSNLTSEEKISAAYLFRTINTLPPLETTALKSCRGKVLDIGAGSGCHSLILQNRGFDITALDNSQLSAEVMKKKGLKKVVLNDIFDYNIEKFDTLLLLMNGIGLTGTVIGLEKFLKHARSLLLPGGQIIFDSSDIDYLYTERDGSKWIDLNAAYYGEMIYHMKYKNISGEKFNWLYIDFEMAKKIGAKNGFELKMLSKGIHFNYLARFTINN
ncbi:MAG: methyltransferase domain-containing protein [Bacteroidales bacterium]|nr:methyltransferase domain-containing protein [Bacteroidales bacterium]